MLSFNRERRSLLTTEVQAVEGTSNVKIRRNNRIRNSAVLLPIRKGWIRKLFLFVLLTGGLALLFWLVCGISSKLTGHWGHHSYRNISYYIDSEHTSSAIVSPPNMCKPNPYLLIIVNSPVENYINRKAIRETWGNWTKYEKFNNTNIEVVFLTGFSRNGTLNKSVKNENLAYKDVIQENFWDTYHNMTMKSILTLKWATLQCDLYTYVMKTTDDIFVNIPVLLNTLKAKQWVSNTLIGYMETEPRPILGPSDVWTGYPLKYHYRQEVYPQFLSGTGYIMSRDVATKLYKIALLTPMYYYEDLHITGICAQRAKLTPIHYPGFKKLYTNSTDAEELQETITMHNVNFKKMYEIWNKFKQINHY